MTPSLDVDEQPGEWDVGDAQVIDLDTPDPQRDPWAAEGSTVTEPREATDPADYLTKAEYLSKKQAGDILGVSTKTIERAIADPSESLGAYKVLGQIRIKRSEFDDWMEANRVKSAADLHEV